MNFETLKKDELLDLLYSRHTMGIKPGLERTIELDKSVGSPSKKIKTIHVAGTNGKGTICSVIASTLKEKALKVGLYTSPHIVDFNERIRINGKKISDYEIVEIAKKILPQAFDMEATFFEITTIMAFKYFEQKNVDVAVIEVGMGGRLDCTNIITPEVSVISDIDMDHKDFLGDTIEKIAYEKAGIIKNGVPVYYTEQQKNITDVFDKKIEEEKAEKLKSEIISDAEKNYIEDNFISEAFQKNFKAAKTALKYCYPDISEEDIINGLKNIRQNAGYFGRLDLIRKKTPMIIDISHSKASVENLFKSISDKFNTDKWIVGVGIMADKEVNDILDIVKPYCKKLFALQIKDNPRALKAEEIDRLAEEKGIQTHLISNSSDVFNHPEFMDNPSVIFGSFYLAGELWEEVKLIND